MKNFSKSTILGLTFGILLAGYAAFLVFNQNESFPAGVKAGVADNVSGYAWSENVGWLSFNCTDGGTCGTVDYGVSVDSSNGNFSGYAWSENIGWIKFDPTTTPPSSPTHAARLDVTSGGTVCGAQYDTCGWARACSAVENKTTCEGPSDPNAGGWDGWIKMRGTAPDYVVSWNSGIKEFSGFAWGSDVVGWLSFNCADLGVCGSSNYKVIADINTPPTASQLSVVQGDYCSIPSHSLSWTFSDNEDGSAQTSYEFQADNNSDFSSPEVSVSGSSSTSQTTVVAVNPGANQLAYNTLYNWRVKVFDSEGADSGWVNGSTFSTESHLYPDSDFTFTPTSPSQGEEITFTQNATCYDITNSITPCPTSASNYSWDFDYETPPFTEDATGQSATTTYNDTSTHTVALNATDADNNTCRGTNTVSSKSPLPRFKETAPSS